MRRLALISLFALGTGAAIVLILSEAALERLDRPKRVEKLGKETEDKGVQRDWLTQGAS